MKIQEAITQHMVTHLLQLVKQDLGLTDLPKIILIDNESAIGAGTSFGEFDGDIRVVTKGRHPMDVMRTLAHELVHWKQRTMNMELDGNDGSDIENQANAVAGAIMRKFGKMYPEYFLNTLPS